MQAKIRREKENNILHPVLSVFGFGPLNMMYILSDSRSDNLLVQVDLNFYMHIKQELRKFHLPCLTYLN